MKNYNSNILKNKCNCKEKNRDKISLILSISGLIFSLPIIIYHYFKYNLTLMMGLLLYFNSIMLLIVLILKGLLKRGK